MEIEETMLMEIGMDSHRHIVTNAHHSAEGIGTQTHVGILTHCLKALTFLLHGIVIATETIDLKLGSLNL